MTINDFIPVLQAQPFRAFRMHTVRGEFVVTYPLGATLTPLMRIAVVVDDTRVETFALEEIDRCEPFGPPMDAVEAISAIPPEKLANDAQLIAAVQAAADTEFAQQLSPTFDPGTVALTGGYESNGVHTVHATVKTRDGETMFATAGMRWSVHGVEQFENGTSLHLHHLDRPTVEQRVILWPPDRGTFDTFAESMSLQALAKELHRRDKVLADKPAKPIEPPASYFRKIGWTWKLAERDEWQELFGEEPPAFDPTRYEFLYVPRTVAGGRVANPCLTDTATREVLFDLLLTDWDAACRQEERVWHLTLRHASNPDRETTLHIDVERQGATIDDNVTLLPLGWIERHLRNFALYEVWELMYTGLLAGPVGPKQPDVILPLAEGFTAELWAGEPRFPTPFLQPHFKDREGQSVFDLRGTTWSAWIQFDRERPVVTLIFSSGEREAREATTQYPLQFDLKSHRVTSSNLKGSTTIGMMQSVIHHVRGVPWMLEEIPKWFTKGLLLPDGP